MSDYKDYMILLSPPTEIDAQVKKFKKASLRLICEFESMYSKAHISLKNLHRQKAFWVEPLFEQLEKELGPVDKTKNPLPNKLKGKIARKLALAWASSENSKAINETSSSKDKNKPIIIPAN